MNEQKNSLEGKIKANWKDRLVRNVISFGVGYAVGSSLTFIFDYDDAHVTSALFTGAVMCVTSSAKKFNIYDLGVFTLSTTVGYAAGVSSARMVKNLF